MKSLTHIHNYLLDKNLVDNSKAAIYKDVSFNCDEFSGVTGYYLNNQIFNDEGKLLEEEMGALVESDPEKEPTSSIKQISDEGGMDAMSLD